MATVVVVGFLKISFLFPGFLSTGVSTAVRIDKDKQVKYYKC